MNSWQKDLTQEETIIVIHWKCYWLSWCSLSSHISLSFSLTWWQICFYTVNVCTTLLVHVISTYQTMHDLLHQPGKTHKQILKFKHYNMNWSPDAQWSSDVISPSHILCALGCNKRQSLQCNDMHSFLLLLVSLTVINLPHNRQLFSFILLHKCPFHFVHSFFIIVNLSQCHLLCLLLAVGSPTLSSYCDFFSYPKFHACEWIVI